MEEGVFIDRDSERDKLIDLIAATIAGDGYSIIIEGKKGVGKKTLVENTLLGYKDSNINIVKVPSGTIVPFSSFDEMFKELGGIESKMSLEGILETELIPKDAFILTTDPIRYLKKGFDASNIGWLTSLSSDKTTKIQLGDEVVEIETYDPHRVDFEIMRKINNIDSNKFVVLDGLEHLLMFSNKSKVVSLVNRLYDKGGFYIPVSKDALGELYPLIEDKVAVVEPSVISGSDNLKLVRESVPNKVLTMYREMHNHDKKCMFFTLDSKKLSDNAINPELRKNMYLISKKGDFSPSRLNFEIKKAMVDFIRQYKKDAVIILTDIEQLVTNKDVGFSRVYEFISYVRDVAIKYGSEFIIQFNPRAFNAEEELNVVPYYFERLFHIDRLSNETEGLSDLVLKYGESEGIKEALNIINGRKPLLIYIEDLDSLDTKSLEFFKHLMNNVGEGLSVVATSTVNEFDTLFNEKIEIGNLSVDETKELINEYSKLWGITLNDEDVDKIYEATEGNPLYTVELLKSLKGGKFELPKNIESFVKEKLDKFSESQESYLYYALILEKFDAEMLAYMSNPSIEKELLDMDYSLAFEKADLFINKLNELGFSKKEGNEYTLTPLIKDVLSRNISNELKEILHARAFLILSNKYTSKEHLLRSLYHISNLNKNDEMVTKMLDVSKEILKSADENTKFSVLEMLVNSLSEVPFMGIPKDIKNYALEAYINLADMYLNNNAKKAVTLLEAGRFFAHNQSIDDTKVSFSLARVKHLIGDIDSAENMYEELIRAPKRDIRFNSNLGLARIYIEKGEYELFDKHLELAMKEGMNPEFKEGIREYLTGLYELEFNPKTAVKKLGRSKEVLSGRFKDYSIVNIGVALAKAGKKDKAGNYLKMATHSRYPEVRVYALYNLGVLEGNEEYLKTAKEISNKVGLIGDINLQATGYKPLYR